MKWSIKYRFVDPADDRVHIEEYVLEDMSLYDVFEYLDKNAPLDFIFELEIEDI